ncbi:short chain dehydrogenase [Polyplosphaeria fusca]|uniref:Short chain dehydrogenase n=1 Tax=Polyplosphaeria fusca TaxID=682080 RepID=A0A9P4QK51_9PLEO|nr:short chain dehydrogenase [Polyplosphaeria fusca]
MSSTKRIMLITGANQGIGYDTAAHLASASPSNHIIVGARNQEKGLQALSKLQATKPAGTLSLQLLDVTSDASITAAVTSIQSTFGKLDVLVNNAGVAPPPPLTRTSLHATFDTNLYGPALLTAALAPLLKLSPDPRVINVSSGMGSIGLRFDTSNPFYVAREDAYRMSKAALNMLTACQAANYREDGIKVWAFCPGYVITDLRISDDAGADQRKIREESGAESSVTSAVGIGEIVAGERDGETERFVQRFGGVWPW